MNSYELIPEEELNYIVFSKNLCFLQTYPDIYCNGEKVIAGNNISRRPLNILKIQDVYFNLDDSPGIHYYTNKISKLNNNILTHVNHTPLQTYVIDSKGNNISITKINSTTFKIEENLPNVFRILLQTENTWLSCCTDKTSQNILYKKLLC